MQKINCTAIVVDLSLISARQGLLKFLTMDIPTYLDFKCCKKLSFSHKINFVFLSTSPKIPTKLPLLY